MSTIMRIRVMRKKGLRTFLVRFEGPCFHLGRNIVHVKNDLELYGYYYVQVRMRSYRDMELLGVVKAW